MAARPQLQSEARVCVRDRDRFRVRNYEKEICYEQSIFNSTQVATGKAAHTLALGWSASDKTFGCTHFRCGKAHALSGDLLRLEEKWRARM